MVDFNDFQLHHLNKKFVKYIDEDLRHFLDTYEQRSVLVFPPVNSFLRLLIHKSVEGVEELHSFSVGAGAERQTVVCLKEDFFTQQSKDITMSEERLALSRGRGRGRGYVGDRCSPSPEPSGVDPRPKTSPHDAKATSDTHRHRARRPEMQLYVPRGRRNKEEVARKEKEIESNDESRKSSSNQSHMVNGEQGEVRKRKGRGRGSNKGDNQVYVPPGKRQQCKYDSRCHATDVSHDKNMDTELGSLKSLNDDLAKETVCRNSHTERTKICPDEQKSALDTDKETSKHSQEIVANVTSEQVSSSVISISQKVSSDIQPDVKKMKVEPQVKNSEMPKCAESMKQEDAIGYPVIESCSCNSNKKADCVDLQCQKGQDLCSVPSDNMVLNSHSGASSKCTVHYKEQLVTPQSNIDCQNNRHVDSSSALVNKECSDGNLSLPLDIAFDHSDELCGKGSNSASSDMLNLQDIGEMSPFNANDVDLNEKLSHQLEGRKQYRSEKDLVEPTTENCVVCQDIPMDFHEEDAEAQNFNNQNSCEQANTEQKMEKETTCNRTLEDCNDDNSPIPHSELGVNVVQDVVGPVCSYSIRDENKVDEEEDNEDEDDEWDKIYDEEGKCLDPELNTVSQEAMEEITAKLGKVKVKKPVIDYLNYQPNENQMNYDDMEHVIEIYDFPVEFKTTDILSAFQAYSAKGFDIKWVDDTHALGVFDSPFTAKDALSMVHPLLKVGPLSKASKQCQIKAKRCIEFLQPYKPRPETSATTARRLVSGALGIATKVSREQRDAERKKLRDAKDKRRQLKKQAEDIWEGNV